MEKKLCFVVSPIGEKGSPERKHSDKVLKYLIKPVCEELDYEVLRADDIYGTTEIIHDIWNCLDNADLVIADVTTLNANVFTEIGYRLKTRKQLILIKEHNSSAYPFDIQGYRHMQYSLEVDELDESKSLLAKFINQNIPKPKRMLTLYDIHNDEIVFYGNGDIERIPAKKKE